MKFRLSMLIGLILLCCNLNLAAQQELPYQFEDWIYDIDLENGEINLGDTLFSIPEDTVIHDTSGKQFTGLSLLKLNKAIGYNEKNGVITEIWLLNRAPIDPSTNDD